MHVDKQLSLPCLYYQYYVSYYHFVITCEEVRVGNGYRTRLFRKVACLYSGMYGDGEECVGEGRGSRGGRVVLNELS